MARIETTTLPVATQSSPRPSLQRLSPRAAFLSQLIAERYHLAPQREKRQESADIAAGAYADRAKATIIRMPAGYRRTVVC